MSRYLALIVLAVVGACSPAAEEDTAATAQSLESLAKEMRYLINKGQYRGALEAYAASSELVREAEANPSLTHPVEECGRAREDALLLLPHQKPGGVRVLDQLLPPAPDPHAPPANLEEIEQVRKPDPAEITMKAPLRLLGVHRRRVDLLAHALDVGDRGGCG